MAVTAYTFPGTTDQLVKGATLWVNLSRITSDDGNFANNGFVAGADTFIERYASLVIGGVVQTGTNKGGDTNLFTYSKTYGGAADLWGAALTPAIVNSPDFGWAWAIGKINGSLVKSDISYYAIAKNFNFNIPSDATIVGIETNAEGDTYAGGGGTQGIYLDSMSLRVYYTWAPKVRANGVGRGFVYVKTGYTRPKPQKRIDYKVYDPENNFIGTWKNVISEASYKLDVNNLLSSMGVVLEQNETRQTPTIDALVTQSDELLLTEGDESIYADLAAAAGLGTGTDLEVNNNVEVVATWGDFQELVTESGEPIITEGDELIMVQVGAPEGRKIFTGYVSVWELDFGTSENVNTNLLTHSQELNNIMLETPDTLKVSGAGWDNTYVGISGGGPDDNQQIQQSFVMVGSVAVNRIRLRCRSGWSGTDIPVTLTLTNGTVPGTPGTTLATASSVIKGNIDDTTAWQDVDFVFDQVSLVNGTTYEFYLDTTYSKTGGNPTYPANFQTGVGSNNNVLVGKVGATWYSTGKSLVFGVYQPGGATTVTFNSTDPSNIWKQIIDFAQSRGSRIGYRPDTIDNTGTQVSVTFKTNTVAEALDATLKLCPADWYYYFDPGENMTYLRARPTTPSNTFYKGKDVVSLKLKKSIEKLVNDVYFSGGGTPTNLFIRNTDQGSINTYRRGLEKMSDNRVTDQTTAQILSQSEIDRFNDPIYSGSMTVISVDFPIEDVTVGELEGFSGFGGLVDLIDLQLVSRTYHPDKLDGTLNILLPPINKRIEDIKRNLEAEQQLNNPASPTVL